MAQRLAIDRSEIRDLLVLALARLFDRPRFARDGTSDRVSLPHVLTLLRDRETRLLVLDRAENWTPAMPDLAPLHRHHAARALMRALVRHRRLQTARDPRAAALAAIQHWRDGRLAHRFLDAPKLPPSREQLTSVMDLAGDLLGLLELALTGESLLAD